MNILAFDQSTTKTGFFVSQNQLYGVIDKGKILDIQQRTKEMYLSIVRLIDENKPDVVVIEDIALQTNAKTLISLANLQGMIIAYCYLNDIIVEIYSPTEWRKALGFTQGRTKREDLKAQAINYVSDHFMLDVSEDAAEAICLYAAYMKRRKKDE